MNISRFRTLVLLTVILSIVGCVTRLRHDPLVGWTLRQSVDQSIAEDYRAYIDKLPNEERRSIVDKYQINFFEDGSGQCAVEIYIPRNGTRWKHVLIYNKDGKRTTVIKYASSRYMS